jgi:hypothetical protein
MSARAKKRAHYERSREEESALMSARAKKRAHYERSREEESAL